MGCIEYGMTFSEHASPGRYIIPKLLQAFLAASCHACSFVFALPLKSLPRNDTVAWNEGGCRLIVSWLKMGEASCLSPYWFSAITHSEDLVTIGALLVELFGPLTSSCGCHCNSLAAWLLSIFVSLPNRLRLACSTSLSPLAPLKARLPTMVKKAWRWSVNSRNIFGSANELILSCNSLMFSSKG